MGELGGAIVFFSLALFLAAVALKLKKPADILMSASLIAAPWWGGVWVGFIGLDLRLTHFFMFGALAMASKSKLKIRKKDKLSMSIIIPASLLIIWLTFSSFQAHNQEQAMSGAAGIFLSVMFLVTIISVARDFSNINYMIKSIGIGIIITSIIALIQYKVHFFHIGFIDRDFTTFMFWRTRSTFHHANQYGTYQLLLLPLIFRQMVIEIKGKKKSSFYFFVFVFVLSLFTLYTTGNRGSWVGLVFGIGFTVMMDILHSSSKKTKKVLMRVVVLIFIMGVAFSARYGQRIYNRFYGKYESNYKDQMEHRKELNTDAYRLINTHPYLGVGYKNYNYHKTTFIFTHNVYLLIMSEAGIIGFCFFIFTMIGFMREALKIRKTPNFIISNLGNGLLATLLGLLLASYVGPDFWISDQVSSHLWIVAGVVIASKRIYQDYKYRYLKQQRSKGLRLDKKMQVPVESYTVNPQNKMITRGFKNG